MLKNKLKPCVKTPYNIITDSMSRLMYWVSCFFFLNLTSSLYDVLWFHDQKEFHLRKTLNVSEYESEVYSIYPQTL